MNPDRPPHRLDSCPLPEVLAAYSVGKLSPEQTQAITEHVEACESCEESLEDLDNDDTLVVALQRHGPSESELDENVREVSRGARADTDRHRSCPDTVAGQRVGPYELREKLGQGAMGVVYKARQVGFNRLVALKMSLSGGLLGHEARARFRIEGEAIARLKHPNIVCVYDCGEHDGQPYFSMELVEGQSLSQKLGMGPLAEKKAAELVRTLARAVAFAHEQEVIHRDLKPANVLLDADGAVKLTDFGLAKLLDAEVGQTQRETVLGTASYMSPEQARGDLSAVGRLADVYGLGAILYETLTGRPPFRSGSRAETLHQVQTLDPVPPSKLRLRLCRSLEAICLKCLEKDPRRRYASATALAEDLERWMENRPTRARPVGPLLRCWKAVQRRPALAPSVLACVLAITMAALWWSLCEPTLEQRYEQRVAPLLAQLQHGETVDLIQPEGNIPAFMVRCGDGITKVRMTADGFIVTTPGLGLVELLPRVPISDYRIHAELRHDRTRFGPVGDAGVGVTFTGRHVNSPDGGQHVVAAVGLNDWDQRQHDKKLQSRAMLQLVWYLDTPTDGENPFKHRLLYPPKRTAWYPSPVGSEGIMHTLVIDVHPEATTAELGDCPGQKMGPLLPAHFLTFSSKLHAGTKEVKDVEIDPLNQPAIGVLVSGGQCTIRRLRIVPQPQATQ